MKSKYSLNYLVGKYRKIVQSNKTAEDIEIISISEEKAKQSKMHGATHENRMNSLSEQGNLLWGTDNFSGVAGFEFQVC